SLAGGDYGLAPCRAQQAWVPQEMALDDVELVAERVSEIPVKPPKQKDDKKDGQAKAVAKKEEKKDDKKAEPPPPVKPAEGKLCLKLEIKPKKKGVPPPKVLGARFVAINGRAVRLPRGSLVRISAFVFSPEPITASLDGALLYDSAGGEPLAVRLAGPQPWKKFTLYRRVPASGMV